MLRHRCRNNLQNKTFYIESFSRHFERFTNLRTRVMPVTSVDAGPPEVVSNKQNVYGIQSMSKINGTSPYI